MEFKTEKYVAFRDLILTLEKIQRNGYAGRLSLSRVNKDEFRKLVEDFAAEVDENYLKKGNKSEWKKYVLDSFAWFEQNIQKLIERREEIHEDEFCEPYLSLLEKVKSEIIKGKDIFLKRVTDVHDGKEQEEPYEPLNFDNISQKLLLLESLGVLNSISEKTGEQISSRKMGRILADLLKEKETTVTRALRYFNPHSAPQDKNNPRTKKNLEKLHSDLIKLKLPELAKPIEQELTKIYKAKD